NLLMAVGTQIRALEDRLYVQALITNGNETQIANLQMDDLPGVNIGAWYDFGGTWDEANKRWILFGGGLSDVDYRCKRVLRVGGAVNLVPMDRRSEFTNAELNRVRVVPGAPGGTGLLALLGGAGFNPNAAGTGQFAADAFDSYTYDAFAAFKYRGVSIYTDWWFRDINTIRGRRFPAGNYPGNGVNQPILYTSNFGTSLFPGGIGLFDYGTTVQAGYFIVPKKLEVAARYSWIRGESGNINGNGTSRVLSAAERAGLGIPAAAPAVQAVNRAFQNFQQADEWAFGVNYFFKRHLVKWQTDVSFYNGGNPAAGGSSAAGFIPGVDGWMVRSQMQIAF